MKKLKTIADLGMKIRVPYNHDLTLIDQVIEYKDYIDSIYLAPSSSALLTSGAGTLLPTVPDYDEIVRDIIRRLKRHNIDVYMLLNAYYITQDILMDFKGSTLYTYLRKMDRYGLQHVTVADILLAQRIRTYFPDWKIEASVNAKIDSVTKARYWKECVGVDSITVLLDINKKPLLIKAIKEAVRVPITMIAHEICVPDCPYEIQHCLSPLFYKGGSEPIFFDCGMMMRNKPWLAYQGPIIVPYNLRYYKGIVEIVKLAGRRYTTEHIVNTIRHYALNINSLAYFYNHGIPARKGEALHPYLQQFIFNDIKHPYLYEEPKSVFKKTAFCNRDCAKCDWCYKTWKKFCKNIRPPSEFKELKPFFIGKKPKGTGDKLHSFRLRLEKRQIEQELQVIP